MSKYKLSEYQRSCRKDMCSENGRNSEININKKATLVSGR